MQKEKSSEEQEYMNDEETAEESEEEEHPSKEEKTEEKERTGEKEKSPLASKVEEKENVESINIEKEAPTQKELVVPVLELEEIQKTEIERSLNKEIPTIEKEEREISVPIVDLKLPSFTLKRSALNLEIPEIKKEERQLIIPKIQLKPVPSLSLRITELDTRIEKPQVSLKLPKVPFYRTEKYGLKSSLTSFDTTINEELKLLLLEGPEEDWVSPESAEKETVEQMVTTVAAEPEAPSGGSEEEEDIPDVDVLDLIFEGEVGRIAGEGVKVILLKNKKDDECTEFLKEVCKRIYREQVGGEPTYKSITEIKELTRFRPEGVLLDIDLDDIVEKIIHPPSSSTQDVVKKIIRSSNSSTKDKIEDNNLYDIIKDTEGYKDLSKLLKQVPHANQKGFILLTTKSWGRAFHEILNIINNEISGRLSQNIIELESRELSKSSKCAIASLYWGMVDLLEDVRTPIQVSFDKAFNDASKVFEEKLEKIREDFQLIPRTSSEKNSSESQESELHFGIKTFLVKIIAHEKGLLPNKPGKLEEEDVKKIKEEISTEKKLHGDIIPDIWVEKDSIAYEVETLFGIKSVKESKTPQKRFQEDVIDKYNEPDIQAKKLNIIMDNFGFLMHLKDIKTIRHFYKHHSPKVEFYTLDLQNDKIIPFGDVVKRLKKIKEENEKEISKKDEKEINGGYA